MTKLSAVLLPPSPVAYLFKIPCILLLIPRENRASVKVESNQDLNQDHSSRLYLLHRYYLSLLISLTLGVSLNCSEDRKEVSSRKLQSSEYMKDHIFQQRRTM